MNKTKIVRLPILQWNFKLGKFDFFFCLTRTTNILVPTLDSPPKGRRAEIVTYDDPVSSPSSKVH